MKNRTNAQHLADRDAKRAERKNVTSKRDRMNRAELASARRDYVSR